MKGILKAFRKSFAKPYVAKINLIGDIDHVQTSLIIKSLGKIKPEGLQAIAINVNSKKGGAAQAVIISERLRNFSKKHNVPLLSFAEDHSLSAGYMVLACGDEVYCQETSLVGSIGSIYQVTKLGSVLAKYGIDFKSYTANPNNMSELISPYLDNANQTRRSKHLKKIATNTRTLFTNYVKNYRHGKVGTVKKIFEGEMFMGSDALKYGLVDGFGSCEEILEQKFPGAKIKDQTSRRYFERVEELFGPLMVKSEWGLVKRKISLGLLNSKFK